MKFLTTLALFAGVAAAQSKPTALTGVWRITEVTTTGPRAVKFSNPQPGLFMFTAKHYSMMWVHGEKPRADADVSKATDAELLAMWRAFSAQSGTYEISGATVTLRPITAKSTVNMRPGRYLTDSFKVEGNTLAISTVRTSEGPTENPETMKLTRIE
jgi:hypothetical protein